MSVNSNLLSLQLVILFIRLRMSCIEITTFMIKIEKQSVNGNFIEGFFYFDQYFLHRVENTSKMNLYFFAL